MVSKPSEDIDIPFYQKVIALFVVSIIAIIIFFIGSALLNRGNTDETSGYATCDSRFDPTACPEPDYDEWLKDNPDLP